MKSKDKLLGKGVLRLCLAQTVTMQKYNIMLMFFFLQMFLNVVNNISFLLINFSKSQPLVCFFLAVAHNFRLLNPVSENFTNQIILPVG
jgi:hypothetical protein